MTIASRASLEQKLGLPTAPELAADAAEPRSARLGPLARRGEPGPTLIAVGGVHGNEPAGVAASRAVLGRLRARGAPLRGEVVALIGNVRALAAGAPLPRARPQPAVDAGARRRVAPRRGRADDRRSGARELIELCGGARSRRSQAARGPVYVLDLHTTSAPGIPFGVDRRDRRRTARSRRSSRCPRSRARGAARGRADALPRRRGLRHAGDRGRPDRRPDVGANLEAVLRDRRSPRAGAVAPAAGARASTRRARTSSRARAGDLPQLIEVYPAPRGQARARVPHGAGLREHPPHRRRHAARARPPAARSAPSTTASLLLPLYQAQGNDGFFFGRALS